MKSIQLKENISLKGKVEHDYGLYLFSIRICFSKYLRKAVVPKLYVMRPRHLIPYAFWQYCFRVWGSILVTELFIITDKQPFEDKC